LIIDEISDEISASVQEEEVDADQVPHWIRAHFVMEERWGELEAEHSAAAQAVHLAEAWGMVRARVPSFLNIARLCNFHAVLPRC
jgi:hypothetical protein